MIAWFKIASRNVGKNRRRSIVTILAVSLGLAAVNLFGGFAAYMYEGNQEAAIYGWAGGHLTIVKEGFFEKGRLDPPRYLLTPDEIDRIQVTCDKTPHVLMATPQLMISGLVTNGRVSTIFIAQGLVPSALEVFFSRTKFEPLKHIEGKRLEDGKMNGVAMARGLARMLEMEIGADGVAFTNTQDGHLNALDFEVFQLFDTDSEAINDMTMRVPFSFAQALYDTGGADRVAVLLDKTEHTETVRDQLRAGLRESGMALDIRTWNEQSQWYGKVKEMFDVIFLLLFFIVFVIVVTNIVNTMSMTVLERTREIGTLRALGLKRRGVMLLFAIESGLLGAMGTIGGLFLSFLGWLGVYFFKPTWIPPGITKRIEIRIEFIPEDIIYSVFLLLLLCMIASILPARRAARQNVVDSLAHV